MADNKLSKVKAEEILDKFIRIQNSRQRSLELLLRINKKAADYKIKKLKQKLEELIR